MSFGDIVPEGAGVLDSIVDMGDGLLEVNNSAVFYPGQRVSVYAKNWVLRGWVTIKEVSLVRTTEDKPVLIFDGPLPAGTCRGDRLVVEHADDNALNAELKRLVLGCELRTPATRERAVEKWRQFAAWFNTGNPAAIWTRLRFWYKPWTWFNPRGAWIVPNDNDTEGLSRH